MPVNENEELEQWSYLTAGQALSLIGKTIKTVTMGEYHFGFTTTDGKSVKIHGHTAEENALEIRHENH